MNRLGVHLLLLVCVFSMQCCSQTVKEVVDTGSIQNRVDLKIDENVRHFLYYVPSSYNINKKIPLVIVLHGGGGTAEKIQKISGWDEKAEKEGFITVYPNGWDKRWNVGKTSVPYEANNKNMDDVSFISETIKHVQTKFAVDEKRVYVVGVSNGAMMTYRLACEIPDQITAVAPLIGSMLKNYFDNAIPKKPIPILIMNGTEDPLVPWDGGDITVFKKKLGKVVSIAEVTSFWINNNNCFSLPETRKLPDKNSSDGSTVSYQKYHAKKNGKDVILYTVHGGGHTWPGGPQYLPEWVIGKTNQDVNAVEIIWDFFTSHIADTP